MKIRRRNNVTQQVDRDQLQRELLLRPPKKTFGQQIKDLIYDPKEKTCLTRTPINWLSITVYYLIFLTGVILVFIVAMMTTEYISEMNHHRPQYILGNSPIGTTPTLNYFPLSKAAQPLLWISDFYSYSEYVRKINDTFTQFKARNNSFDMQELGACAKYPFGYDVKTPCIYFRLNRLIMWKPVPYQKGDVLPKNIPEEVKKYIEESKSPKIWIHCEGMTPKDRDHILPTFFIFQGDKGIDPSPFPFDGQANFVDPIVAMQLNNTNRDKIVYTFSCSAWAKHMDVEKTRVDVNYYFE